MKVIPLKDTARDTDNVRQRFPETGATEKQGEPRGGEEENGSGPVEKAGKRFHLDHTGRRKLGNGFGNAAGQLGTKAGEQGGLRQDVIPAVPHRRDADGNPARAVRPRRTHHERPAHRRQAPRAGNAPASCRTEAASAGKAGLSAPDLPFPSVRRTDGCPPWSGRRKPAGTGCRVPRRPVYRGRYCPRIGSVRTVAQGKVGSSFQQGKQVTLARITTAAIPGGHQS